MQGHLCPTDQGTALQVTRILAVRHGETAWNRDTRIQGHTDIELNTHGRWQAERLAHALREEPIAAFYASEWTLNWTLWIIVAGTTLTILSRSMRLIKALKAK